MNSSITKSFRKAFAELHPQIQKAALQGFQRWRNNPQHPSLHFKKTGDYWSVRISRGYRALARETEGHFTWFWIGSHDEYERIIQHSGN